MFEKIKNLFKKEKDIDIQLPQDETAEFILKLKSLTVGHLACKDGMWTFYYDDEFKAQKDVYHRIVGFPNLDKKYTSPTLWPFFLIRIPGLKQPAIKEIIEEEKLDQDNEAALLKRFGFKSISNPYLLRPC